MQEAKDMYYTACYSPQFGIKRFYNTLINHTKNMSIFPDNYNLMDMFLQGIPKEMRAKMYKNGSTPEANTIKDFMAEGKAIEEATKTMDHYN